jgi:hypothetical protein
LVNEGDWVETHPLDAKALKRVEDAAVAWARHYGYIVSFQRKRWGSEGRSVKITLKQKYREDWL